MTKNVVRFAALALVLAVFEAVAPAAQAQGAAQAQKLAALAKQLNLTPAQKTQLMPVLEADAPKLEAIKSNPSLGPLHKDGAAQGHPRAERSANQSDSQPAAVPAVPADSPTGNSAGHGREDGPVKRFIAYGGGLGRPSPLIRHGGEPTT